MKWFQHLLQLQMLLLSFLTSTLLGEGFSPGTLVYTNRGLVAIEQITLDDKVKSFDRKKNKWTESEIHSIAEYNTNAIVELVVGQATIRADVKQRFLDSDSDEWHQAQTLKPGQRVVSDGAVHTIKEVQKINGPALLYTLSLCGGPHNYCVSGEMISVHNAIPVATIMTGIKVTKVVGEAGLLAWNTYKKQQAASKTDSCEKTAQSPENDVSKQKTITDAALGGIKSGGISGAVLSTVELGLGVANGDIPTVGRAAASIGIAAGKSAAMKAGLEAGKTVLLKAGEKIAPDAVRKIQSQ